MKLGKQVSGVMFVVAVVVGLVATGVAPASATPLTDGAMTGSGTISPGLDLTAQDQTVALSGTVIGVANAIPATCTVSFTGNSQAETISSGFGSGSASCNGAQTTGPAFSISCTISYSRTGAVVTLSGSCTSGPNPGNLIGAILLVPTSASPVRSYELAGVVSIG